MKSENFPNLMKDIELQVWEADQTQKGQTQRNPHHNTHKQILKTKRKKNPKSTDGGSIITYYFKNP